MIKIVYQKLNVYCYYFNELECIQVVGVGINNFVLEKINEYKTQTDQLIKQSNVKKKTIIKKQSQFQFTLPNGEAVEVNGELLIGRPEIRIKKQIPKKRV